VFEPGPVIYIEIPLFEFERLHAEIRELTSLVHRFAEENARLRAENERLSRALSHS